jgi:hypothetical protein
VLSSTSPPAVERGRAPTEGGSGGGRADKVIHNDPLWALPQLALVLQPGLIALSGLLATGVSWFVNGNGLYDAQISFFIQMSENFTRSLGL